MTAGPIPPRQRRRSRSPRLSSGQNTCTASSASSSSASLRARDASASEPSSFEQDEKARACGQLAGKATARGAQHAWSGISSAAGSSPLPITRPIAAQPKVEHRRRRRPPTADSRGPGQTAGQHHHDVDAERPLQAHEQASQVISGDVLGAAPPTLISSPGATAASRPVTQRPVTPYLNARGPPALVATLPPSCDCSAAPGLGANSRPLLREPGDVGGRQGLPRPPRATTAPTGSAPE